MIDADGTITNADTQKFLQGFVDRYVAWVKALRQLNRWTKKEFDESIRTNKPG